MSLEPCDWNVIVVGLWNRAILSPDWIARFLFKLTEESELNVLIPTHVVGPIRVSHDKVAVVPTSSQLIVEVQDNSYERLQRAMTVARRAIFELPKTPLAAAGINIRLKGPAGDRKFAALDELLRHPLDQRFGQNSESILKKQHSWTIPFQQGVANIKIALEDAQLTVSINFDRQSGKQTELEEWLSMPVGQIEAKVTDLLVDKLGLEALR